MQLRRGYKRLETGRESIQSSTKSAIDTKADEERSQVGGRIGVVEKGLRLVTGIHADKKR
jgi:hypothetical protein